MKNPYTPKVILALVSLSLPLVCSAANVSMTSNDGYGTSSLTSVGKWGPDSTGHAALPPQATNDYFSSAYYIRTPGDSGGITTTFAGHSLTLQQPASGNARSIIFKGGSGDIIVINNLTNAYGGILENGGSGNSTVTYTGNLFTIAANSVIDANQGPLIVGYPLAGADGVILTNAGGNGTGIIYSNNNSAFTGKFWISSSANYGNGGGNTTVRLDAANSAPGNPSTLTPDQITLEVGCTLRDDYGLMLNNANGGITLVGNANIYAAKTTVIGEPITDNGSNYVLTSTGPGTLVLSNQNNTYAGGTTISAGTLMLGTANALPNSGPFTANATLNLNTYSATVGALNGSGTVDTVAGGTPTLTIGNGNANGYFSGAIQNTAGTLSLTKIGSGGQTLAAGYAYSGRTLVTGGTLTVNTTGSVPSTPGDLVVSNGATLTVNASGGTALPANNVTVGPNGILGVAATGAANGVSAAGALTLQDNAMISLNYGTVSANPTVAAVNAASLTAPGAGIVIQITETGMKAGAAFPVVKYSGTQLANLNNFTLVMPLGVAASLVNGSGEIDVQITSTPNKLVWNGLNSADWDTSTANWTNPATGTLTTYQQYTVNSVVVGDSVTFDDTLYQGGNPWPTNVNVTGTFSPYPLTVNSTLPYTLAGPGGLDGGSGFYLLKTNTGSLTLLTTNNFGGGFYIGGGSVIITNDAALGASSGLVTLNNSTLQVNGNTADSARAFSVPVNSTIGVATNVTAEFGAVSGAGGLTKTDDGTLVLAGSNTITGVLTVNQGTLVTTGTNILSAVPIIGNSSGVNGVLNIAGGVFQANNNGGQTYSTSLTIGSGSPGDVVMTGGALSVRRQLTVGPNNFGAFSQSGGATAIGGFIACGGTSSGGVFNQSGGLVQMNGSSATIGYGATTTFGVMNLSGNAVFQMIGSGNGIWPGEVGNGALNVWGNAALSITNSGLVMGRGNAAGNGTVNLDGGTVTVNSVVKGSGSGTLNLNGGTLRANMNTNGFIAGLTSANVYNGGAVIDDGGNTITIPQPLLGVTAGSGLVSIPLLDGGSGYVDTPVVVVSDSSGYGSNTMATAQVDPATGTITNIIVTCPGSGWDPTYSAISLTFIGGGANTTPPNVDGYAGTYVANGTGGLTKQGAGTVTLTGVNTFLGPITNNAGTLVLNSASTYSGATVNAGTLRMTTASTLTGSAAIGDGATLSIAQSGSATTSLGSLTFNGGAATPGGTLGLALTAGNNPAAPFVTCGSLTLNGTNTISLAGAVQVGSIALIKATGAIAGSGTLTNLILPQGVVGSISQSFDGTYTTISAVITSTGPGLVWTGTNSAPGKANLWDVNSTVNWLLGATPTTYQQTIVPGDAVTFNDVGSGTVLLSNSVGPASLVISNNNTAYTFSGSGNITGPTGLKKLGTGTAVINLVNDNYTGDTVVNDGTLEMGSASALSSAANLNIGSGGTVELAGISSTFGELVGSGVVDNDSGNAPILTVGTSAGGAWNGSIQDHGSGGVALHKVGTGTWIVGGQNYLNDGQPFTDQSQISAGTVIITNGGLLSVGYLQLQIANGAGSSASVVVDGGTLAVTNNVLSVGYGDNSAVGTLTVNNGTVLHGGNQFGGAFAAVPNSIDVGAQGASGTLTVNGGQVLNGQTLYLGDGTGANGTLNLNGGLLQAAQIIANGAPNSSTANFNGGTLQAVTNSADFLHVTCQVMSKGLVLDDNGWTLSIGGAVLQDGGGGGGLFKMGSGTVYLDTPNSYTGLTVVTNGTLAGIGSVAGSVLVTATGAIGSGDAAAITPATPFTIAGNLTMQNGGGAVIRISKTGGTKSSDEISVTGSIAYGGTLTINNVTSDGTPLTVGDTFQIFNQGGTGNFTSVTGPGATYSFDPTSGVLTVTSVVIGPGIFTNPTGITSFRLDGSNVVLTGTNGESGAAYYLLESTNVASPLSQWVPVATNVLGANGDYTFTATNVVAPDGVQQFYILSNTNN